MGEQRPTGARAPDGARPPFKGGRFKAAPPIHPPGPRWTFCKGLLWGETAANVGALDQASLPLYRCTLLSPSSTAASRGRGAWEAGVEGTVQGVRCGAARRRACRPVGEPHRAGLCRRRRGAARRRVGDGIGASGDDAASRRHGPSPLPGGVPRRHRGGLQRRVEPGRHGPRGHRRGAAPANLRHVRDLGRPRRRRSFLGDLPRVQRLAA